MLRLAVTAGANVTDPDLTALTAVPPAPPPPAPVSAAPAPPGVLLLPAPPKPAAPQPLPSLSAVVEDGAAAAVLTADQLLAAAGPRLHVPALAAALLKLLLLHGGVLLAHSMPPAAEALEVGLLARSEAVQ